MTYRQHIDAVWNLGTHLKVNWLLLETEIRAVLRRAGRQEIGPAGALALIDELFAAYTRRGNELAENFTNRDVFDLER